VATLVSTLIMLVIPFVVQSKSDDRMSRLLAFCGASALFTMASPIAWVHHYNILLPVYVVALRAAFDRWEGARAHIALSCWHCPWCRRLSACSGQRPDCSINEHRSVHVLMGAFLLIGVLLVELRTPLRKTTDDLRIDPA